MIKTINNYRINHKTIIFHLRNQHCRKKYFHRIKNLIQNAAYRNNHIELLDFFIFFLAGLKKQLLREAKYFIVPL